MKYLLNIFRIEELGLFISHTLSKYSSLHSITSRNLKLYYSQPPKKEYLLNLYRERATEFSIAHNLLMIESGVPPQEILISLESTCKAFPKSTKAWEIYLSMAKKLYGSTSEKLLNLTEFCLESDLYSQGILKQAIISQKYLGKICKAKELLSLYALKYDISTIQNCIFFHDLLPKDLFKKNEDEYKKREITFRAFTQNCNLQRLIDELSGNKSVSIVGNSLCEAGKLKGKKIDSFNKVIRFNNFLGKSFQTIDYGKKVNIWVLSTSPTVKFRDPRPLDYIVFSSDITQKNLNLKQLEIVHTYAKHSKVCFIPEKLTQELVREHDILSPSAGLKLLWLLIKTNILSKESIFGFNLLDQLSDSMNSLKKKDGYDHDWKREREIFDQILQRITS